MTSKATIDVAVVTLEWRQGARVRSPFHLAHFASSESHLVIGYLSAINDHSVGPSGPDSHPAECAAQSIAGSIRTGGNLGYGGGNNVAAAWAFQRWSPRYLLILNPDVEIDRFVVEALVKQADSEPEVAVLGPVQEVKTGEIGEFRRGMRYFRSLSVIRAVSRRAESVDYINGGALLVRVAALRGELPFTDEFFLFFEELELCDRMKRRGYKIAVCEESQVTHYEGGVRASRRDADYCPEVSEYFENLNALRFTKKYCPWWLPTVLVVRLLLKPVVLLARRDRVRFGFWWLAIEDFFLRRVTRFPFQQGWNPRLSGESLRDAPWPKFASKADLR